MNGLTVDVTGKNTAVTGGLAVTTYDDVRYVTEEYQC